MIKTKGVSNYKVYEMVIGYQCWQMKIKISLGEKGTKTFSSIGRDAKFPIGNVSSKTLVKQNIWL